MPYTIKLQGTITQDRRLIVALPDDAEVGQVHVVIRYTNSAKPIKGRRTAQKKHPAFGMWAKRLDFQDSGDAAAALRKRLEQREDGR